VIGVGPSDGHTARRSWAGRGVFVLLAALLSALVGAAVTRSVAPAGGPAGSWSVAASPNEGVAPSTNQLASVSCPSAQTCIAVGEAGLVSGARALVESWDGTSWSILPSPINGPGLSLSSVSCASPVACATVGLGGSGGSSILWAWNGIRWTIQAGSGGGLLDAVSCAAPSACMAVGIGGPDGTALAEVWNGYEWTVVPTPHVGPLTAFDSLNAVSCPSPGDCVAVGSYGSETGNSRTLVEAWDGTSWSVVPSPDRGAALDDNALDGVSCASPRTCVAVGEYSVPDGAVGTLTESFNGSAWSLVPSPNAGIRPVVDELAAVSCASASSCTAVGDYDDPSGGPSRTLVETWDGSTWSIAASPDEGTAASANELSGVSCTRAGTCTAVGTFTPHVFGQSETLVVRS
jgi:hypothetical protein